MDTKDANNSFVSKKIAHAGCFTHSASYQEHLARSEVVITSPWSDIAKPPDIKS